MRYTRNVFQLVLPALIVLIFIFFIPPIYNVLMSLQELDLFEMSITGLGGKFIGLRNYIELIKDPLFYKVLLNTCLWLTGVTVLLRLVLGFALALLLDTTALKRWHLTEVGRTLLFLPWAVPPVVAVTIWKWLLNSQYGFVNLMLLKLGLIATPIRFLSSPNPYITWWSIIFPIIWKETPFAAIVFLSGLQSIPQELYEVAKLDGAGWFGMLRYVTIPLMKSVTMIVTFMLTLWTFNNFVYVWLTTRGGPGNLTHVMGTMVYYQSFVEYEMGYGATFGVLMMLVTAAFGIIYLKFFFRRG